MSTPSGCVRRAAAVAMALALVGTSLAGCAAESASPITREAAAPVADVSTSRRTLAAMPVPLTLEPPASMPIVDLKPGLATWRSGIDEEDAIRIMTPVTVGPPRGGERAAPEDLHRYLVSRAPFGVRTTDDRAVALRGLQAHLFTVTTTRVVPAGLGCWSDAADACFDVPPGRRLRVATFAVRGRPVIAWASTSSAHPSTLLGIRFERMLASIGVLR